MPGFSHGPGGQVINGGAAVIKYILVIYKPNFGTKVLNTFLSSSESINNDEDPNY